VIQFRRTVAEDVVTIASWIMQDPRHQHIDAEFFLCSGKGISCYAVESDVGPVMFVRQEADDAEVTTLHIQFAPSDRKRIVEAMREGYPLVAADAKMRGFKRVRFDSASPALVRTMLEMGFRAELVAEL
jgi:hypothetical protein